MGGFLGSIAGALGLGAGPSGAAAVGGGMGSLFSSALQYSNAEQNRSFQRSMDDTKYQRSMADMKKAGLNPLLAGNLGAASAPSGASMGTIENPVASAAQLVKTMAEVSKLNAETQVQKNIAGTTAPGSRVGNMVDKGIEKIQNKVAPISNVREYTHKAANSKRRVKEVLQQTTPDFDNLVNEVVNKRKSGSLRNSPHLQKLINTLPGNQKNIFWQTVGKRLRGK